MAGPGGANDDITDDDDDRKNAEEDVDTICKQRQRLGREGPDDGRSGGGDIPILT